MAALRLLGLATRHRLVAKKSASRRSTARLQLQSVVFPQKHWTIKTARAWLAAHGHKSRGVDVERSTYRFRQEDPRHFIKSSYATIHFGPNILATMAHRRR